MNTKNIDNQIRQEYKKNDKLREDCYKRDKNQNLIITLEHEDKIRDLFATKRAILNKIEYKV